VKKKVKPGKFSLEKVAPDVISLLFLANLTRKLYGNRKALRELRKAILNEKPIDSEAYIRKHYKLSVPLVVVSKMEHIADRVVPAMAKIGIDKAKAEQVRTQLQFAFPHVMVGNGFASLIADEAGKKMFALVVVPQKANEFLLKHELGHVIYRLKEGRPMIKGFKLDAQPFLRSVSYLSRIYSKRAKYGIEKEEKVAWDIAGVPRDNPLRKLSQKSYETSMGFTTAGLKWVLVSAFSPQIRKWARKLEAAVRGEKLKEDLTENSGLVIKRSSIHGKGVFATRLIHPGVIKDEKSWSDAINHSKNPNAELLQNGDIKILRRISAGEELTFDYRKMKQWPGTEVHWEELSEGLLSPKEGQKIKMKTQSYKFDEWLSGETPLLFVVGYSGAGKTTFASMLAKKYKARHFDLDDITWSGKGVTDSEMEGLRSEDDETWSKTLLKVILKRANRRTIVDGVQILDMRDQELKKLKNFAFMFTSTSYPKAVFRAQIRNLKNRKYEKPGEENPRLRQIMGMNLDFRKRMKDLKRILGEEVLTEKSKSKIVKLKDNRRPLTPEERAEVMDKKATWHHGPNGEPSPAVWKSINPTTGEVTYITNTHRAYQARPTLKGAIGIYHKFIKSTA